MWEFHLMTSEEFHELFDQFKPVLDQRQFLFAEVEGEPVGFCFGLPDWTPLFRSLKGKMGPLQILRLMLRAKRYDRAGLLGIGVLDSQRGKHIGQTLAATLYRRYEELGLRGRPLLPGERRQPGLAAIGGVVRRAGADRLPRLRQAAGRVRLLVTGASGFLGRAVCDELLERDHEVHALVRRRGLRTAGHGRGRRRPHRRGIPRPCG